MALDLETEFVGQIGAASAAYPFGEPRGPVGSPGDGTATPISANVGKEIFGFLHAILVAAGASPSGDAEQADDSQYLDGINSLIAAAVSGQKVRQTDAAEPLYAAYAGGSIGSALADVDADIDIVRQGDIVTITGSINITASQAEADFVTGENYLPTWALPKRKSAAIVDFGATYFVAVDVGLGENAAEPRQLRVHRRLIADGTDDDFLTEEATFTLSYVTDAALP